MTMSASPMAAPIVPRPPEPFAAMSLKALMMPRTVPRRPTNGAVEPVEASTPMPRERSAAMRSFLRSRARRASSSDFAGEPPLPSFSKYVLSPV